MEWTKNLNKAMDFIEANLTKEISYEDLAEIAQCSTYHFQRMFAYMAGVPLSEYIRRRRMSLAAVELQSTGAKVIEIALKYGYNSPTAFNRAFQSVHGMSPTDTRTMGSVVSSFPPLHFTLSVKGREKMNYRIEEHGEIRIVGISEPLSDNVEENFIVVPALWQRFEEEGMGPKLMPLMSTDLKGLLGVSACYMTEDWRYFIAVASDLPIDESIEEFIIEPFTWAIFSGTGPMPLAIQELEKRIVTEWLPTSGYEYANGPDLEVYLAPDPSAAVFEVWIPVVKANLV